MMKNTIIHRLLILAVVVVFLSACGGNTEKAEEAGNLFKWTTNYTSLNPVGDSVLIGGTKTEPGIKTPGWAFYQSKSGAWGFSIGDGETGFLYQPTAERQGIAEGKKYGLAFALDTVKMEIRWWFNGKNVAIYNVQGLNLKDIPLGEEKPFKHPKASFPDFPETFNVMAWNIWHGGRESGVTEGVARVIDVIKQNEADVICMVETYGSGPIIADSLGYYFYLRSSNLSIMSRFPIGETYDMFRSFNFGGAEIWLSENEKMNVHPLWIHYLPDMNNLKDITVPVDSLLKWEWETRGNEMKAILQEMVPELARADSVPVIMAGDYNSPSHLDWGEEGKEMHNGRTIVWPVSRQMENAGMIDAYRYLHPDPVSHPGHTWSPIFTEAWQDRIDYVYHKGNKLKPLKAWVVDDYIDIFPSDHAGVVVEYQWIN